MQYLIKLFWISWPHKNNFLEKRFNSQLIDFNLWAILFLFLVPDTITVIFFTYGVIVNECAKTWLQQI